MEKAAITMNTNAGHTMRGLSTLALIASLSGCAWIGAGKDPVPRESGLYALQAEKLQRLDGDRAWEIKTWDDRSSFPSNVQFMIRHPQLRASGKMPEELIRLTRVAWVRSEITPDGDILPVDGTQWTVTDISQQRVPIEIQTFSSHPDVARLIPERALTRGIYSLQLRTQSGQVNARVGVAWPGTDRRNYAAANCVDRYLGDQVRYRPCAEQEHALATKWLSVHLVDPETRHVDGQRTLVVSGVVVNTSERKRRVPKLEAQLQTADGTVLKRWLFDPMAAEVAPGASARFRSEITNPPPGTKKVHVTFAADVTQASSQASP
jgi:hypothetical protein